MTDIEISEDGNEWQRLTDEPEIKGVEVHHDVTSDWPFTVSVWVAEFLRADPIEDALRTNMNAALRSVVGVTDVAEDDREIWLVSGSPSGEALTRAASKVVDDLADQSRAFIDSLS